MQLGRPDWRERKHFQSSWRNIRKFLAVLAKVAGNSIANAISEPNKAPKIAKPRFLSVYESVTPPMVRVWREPTVKPWFAATPDRRKFGTRIPAMNTLSVTPLKGSRRERAFCTLV